MSEADTPNPSSGLPESVESAAADISAADRDPSPSQPPLDDGWQTVDFPGALPVDALLQNQNPAAPDAVVDESPVGEPHQVETVQVAMPESDWAPLIEQLREANTSLRSHIVQLENDLTQGQIELQLEKARSLDREAACSAQIGAQTAKHAQEIAIAQEHVGRLMQELDLSHQAAHRQQILVETLTEQLESSQERIAQLERECAVTQQRYNEQVQQRLQAESACRDLRMRLHRQQQHTLQFKVALEKCLEMPNAQVQPVLNAVPLNENVDDLDVSASENSLEDASSPLLALKHQPVKPWSAPQGAAEAPFKFASPSSKPLSVQNADVSQELPDPIANPPALDSEVCGEADASSTPASEPVSEPAAADRGESFQQISNLMNLIFTEDTDNSRYQAEDVQPESEIFDLSPFFAADATQSGELPEPAELPQPEQTSPTAPVNSSAITVSEAAMHQETGDDPVWDDLAKLIDASTARREAEAVLPEAANCSDVQVPSAALDDRPSSTAELIEEAIAGDSVTDPASDPATDRSIDVKPPSSIPEITAMGLISEVRSLPYASAPASPQGSFDLFNAGSTQPTQAASATAGDAANFPASWPSPIVYPTRPAKKLKSLAAVELPMFPRAKQG